MSLRTASVIFIDGCAVYKLPDNQIRIKPLNWLKENKVGFTEKNVSDKNDDNNILQNLANGKVTYDDIVQKYF